VHLVGIYILEYHQDVLLCTYSNWYTISCVYVDWLLAGLILPTPSKYKSMTYTNCSIYRVISLGDEQQACSKHVEVNYWNKLRVNSASFWIILHFCSFFFPPLLSNIMHVKRNKSLICFLSTLKWRSRAMNYNTLNVSQRLSCKSKCIVVKNKEINFTAHQFLVWKHKCTLYIFRWNVHGVSHSFACEFVGLAKWVSRDGKVNLFQRTCVNVLKISWHILSQSAHAKSNMTSTKKELRLPNRLIYSKFILVLFS
jgi:hypothetical protein